MPQKYKSLLLESNYDSKINNRLRRNVLVLLHTLKKILYGIKILQSVRVRVNVTVNQII